METVNKVSRQHYKIGNSPRSGEIKEYDLVIKSERFPGVEWVGDAGDFIKIDEKKCTGCGNCLKVCLGRCFEIRNKLALINNLDECMECAACWYVCGEGAIDFCWPPGGAGYRSDWG